MKPYKKEPDALLQKKKAVIEVCMSRIEEYSNTVFLNVTVNTPVISPIPASKGLMQSLLRI